MYPPLLLHVHNRWIFRSFAWTGLLLVASCAASMALAGERSRPNVLMILVDDLKPTLGCYGDSIAKTPHLDRLAQRGLRFESAYCNQAVCAPSRFTLMLGSHSTSTGLYGLGSRLRKALPGAITIPQHFAKHGYRVESLGKVFHVGHGNDGDPDSFSIPHYHDKVVEYLDPKSTHGGKLTREEALFTNQQLNRIRELPRGWAYEAPEVSDDAYADGRVARETIRRLQQLKQRSVSDSTPFLVIAGFVRPHLPFSAPKSYWDLYDPQKLPMPLNETNPKDAPKVAGKRGGEIAAYEPVPENDNHQYSDELKRSLIHGYYASTSYVDAQIGKVLQAVEDLGLAEDTIIVLWSDHGYHLGDHGIWTKHTNYEQANRIPLIMVAPGVTSAGTKTHQLAESVDVYPTLCGLANLPLHQGSQTIDGVDLSPVLRDPQSRVRDHAFHAYPKEKLGRSIRTDRYRLVEWKNFQDAQAKVEYELYDYQLDPLETQNLAKEQPEILQQLQAILAKYPPPVTGNGPARTRP